MTTLEELLNSRRVRLDEVMAWASALAGQLSTLHDQRQSHGGVVAEMVRIDAGGAHLMPGRVGEPQSGQARDIVEFAALLRGMLAGAEADTPAERAQWNALEGVAAANTHAAEGSRMKKVVLALKLVGPARKAVKFCPAVTPTPAPAKRGQRVLLLVREVSPTEQASAGKAVSKPIRIAVLLASAASLAVFCGLVLLRFVK